MPNRREFLTSGALGLASLGTSFPLSGALPLPAASSSPARSREALSILILGGTSFLGPHQIAYALDRGHSVTTFTRGQTDPTIHPDLFSRVESLTGDREDDLTALRGRSWDAVIDNSGQQVAWTRDSAELLKDQVDLYLYTSSTGVYYPYLEGDLRESRSVALEIPGGSEENGEYRYGVMKANSELAARAAFGEDRTIVVRPGYMLGPGDRTDRFAYWPVRLERGGEILVPGRADDQVQCIDVRDVTEWMIRLIEEGRTGTFNAVGPASTIGMLRFMHGAHAAFGSQAEFVVADDYDFLREHGVSAVLPWIMPVDDHLGSMRVSNARAIDNGLAFRPLADTIRDVYEWWHGDTVSEERRTRLLTDERSPLVREPEVLRAWKARG